MGTAGGGVAVSVRWAHGPGPARGSGGCRKADTAGRSCCGYLWVALAAWDGATSYAEAKVDGSACEEGKLIAGRADGCAAGGGALLAWRGAVARQEYRGDGDREREFSSRAGAQREQWGVARRMGCKGGSNGSGCGCLGVGAALLVDWRHLWLGCAYSGSVCSSASFSGLVGWV